MFTLANLERAIHDAWSLDTAERDDGWTPENPSRGQCDITALVVQDLLGGDILGADVYLDGERIEGHMWNRLSSGIDVDLTREQFRRGETVGEPRVGRRTPAIADPSHPRYHRYEAYLVLSERVRGRLGLAGWNRSAAEPAGLGPELAAGHVAHSGVDLHSTTGQPEAEIRAVTDEPHLVRGVEESRIAAEEVLEGGQ